MKPEKTNIIEIGYIKDKNKYFATFQVLGLDKNEIKRIRKYLKISGHQRNCKPYIKDDNFYITDFFEADLFESMYPHMIKSAKECLIPGRIKPEILNKEMDICMMEQDIDFSVRRAANPKYIDILKDAAMNNNQK